MKRILLLGDSIRQNYQSYVKENLAGIAEVFYPKIHADIVAIDARENILFFQIFFAPCLNVYQNVLILIKITYPLILNDNTLFHRNHTLSHCLDNLKIVSYHQYRGASLVNFIQQLHNLPGIMSV